MGRKWTMLWMVCLSVFLWAGAGRAALVDNGDGTVSDTGTGLMWQQATAPGTYNWEQALAYCEDLSLAGHDDWRLPTIKELRSIVDYTRYNPAMDTTAFLEVAASWYWSSTTDDFNTFDSYYALVMDFYDGFDYSDLKGNSYYVRAVRGGQSGSLGNLVIAMSPMSGPPGTTFTEWGTGFTPNSTATLHFKKPDGTEYPTLAQPIDAIGHFEITYTAPSDKPPGTYVWWGIDGVTGLKSNEVSYEITSAASVVKLTVVLSPEGGGEVTGPGIDCGNGYTDCQESYPPDASVTLTARANDEYEFLYWDDGTTHYNGASMTFTMDADKIIKAKFSRLPNSN